MKTKNLQWALTLCSVIAVSACGGGGDGGGGGGGFPVGGGGTASGPGTANGGALPSSATSSVDAFIAYMKQLVATMSDSSEPLDLGSAVAPASDTTEPAPL